MTEYVYRFFVFVEVGKIIPANNMAEAWDPDTKGEETFGDVKLSATGNDPATHLACNTAATESMKQGIENAFGVVPWSGMYKTADGWTWESALADMGLQIIQTD